MAYDLKTATPDTTIGSGTVLFGADSQSASEPSVFALSTVLGHIDVRAYGAKGDGSTDDTAAIQAAITALQASAAGGTIVFPAGTYKITDTLVAHSVYNKTFSMCGQGTCATIISMATANKPMFSIGTTYGGVIEKMQFKYAADQAITDTDAIAIRSFMTDIVNGFYRMTFRDLWFWGAYTGIGAATQTASIYPFWGNIFINLNFNHCAKSWVTCASNQGGIPNNQFFDIQGDGVATVGPLIEMSAGETTINCIEILNCTGNTIFYKDEGGGTLTADRIDVEGCVYDTNSAKTLISVYGAKSVRINTISFHGITHTGTGALTIVNAGDCDDFFLGSLTGTTWTSATAKLYGVVLNDNVNRAVVGHIDAALLASAEFDAFANGLAGYGMDHVDWQIQKGINNVRELGDVTTCVLTVRDVGIQYFPTLSADCVVTLPDGWWFPANIAQGIKFRIVKPNATVGKLTVTIPTGTGTWEFAPHHTGWWEFVFRRYAGNGWIMVASGTFPGGVESKAQTIAYGATITPVYLTGNEITVGTLTGNITVNNPVAAAPKGMEVTFYFTSDGSARTPSWGTKYLGATLTGASTANQKAVVKFISDGVNLIQTASTGWYTAT